jgi:hypothetical protein
LSQKTDNNSDGKGRTATTGRCCVGIAHYKLLTLQALGVINLGTYKVLITHRVNDQGHITVFDHKITFAGVLIERKTVLKTGTTAAGDIDSQPEIRISSA